jgi:hypothetical protein
MSRPTKQELETALAEAERMRDLDEDPQHIAKCLLYMGRRNEVLERLLVSVEHYLHSGHGQHEQARMIKALDAALDQMRQETHGETPSFGLE